MPDYDKLFQKIQHAQEMLRGIVKRTPLERSNLFSSLAGGDIYLKLENLQKTGSFKVRGAVYAISQLSPSQKAAGVVAASAGNHAQGVAFAATQLGIRSTIVMPSYSPIAKIQATRGYGARVILHGETFDDALERARVIAIESGATFIHPFDDEDVIAGQGTIGLEIAEELPDIDCVVVPVGGGGLISGIAVALKHLRPEVKVYGVEAAGAPSLKESLMVGHPAGVTSVDTICDGIAVKKPGPFTFAIAQDMIDDVVTVEDLEVTRTVFMLLERTKTVAEPAGCVALSAIQHGHIDVRGKKTVAVISGGNIDMSLMAKIVEKELVRMGRSVHLRGTVMDRVGSLNRVLSIIAQSGINVLDIRHDRVDPQIPPNRTQVFLSLEMPDADTLQRLLTQLEENNMHFEEYED